MKAEHRNRARADGFSRWLVKVNGRWRRLEVQEYRGRLYAVGCMYSGHTRVIGFEEPLSQIIRRFGPLKETQRP